MSEDYNPYCTVCESCGEDGCCSAMSCKQSPDGKYCETYLLDLKFGYLMFKDLFNLIEKDPKYKEALDDLYDKNYDRIYKK